MRVLLAAVATMLLVTSAYAQGMGGGMGGGRGRHAKQQQTTQPTKKVDDKAYGDALTRIPDQKPADPWRNMR